MMGPLRYKIHMIYSQKTDEIVLIKDYMFGQIFMEIEKPENWKYDLESRIYFHERKPWIQLDEWWE